MEQKICFNLASLKHLDYTSALETVAEAGFRTVGLQEVHVEGYLASGGTLREARSILDSLGIAAVEAAPFSGWLCTRGEERAAAFARFARFCEWAAALGVQVIISPTICDAPPDDGLALENCREICRIAQERGLAVGLEFIPWTTLKTVTDTLRFIERVNHPAAKIVLDIFHIMKGGSRLDDIRSLPAEKIAIVHVNDLVETGEDVMTLALKRRLLPGEGQFPLREFVEDVRATGYNGWYSLEIMNENDPKEDPAVIARSSMASMKTLLG
jgi:2-keto-myo-inositol isomerase